MANYKVLYPVFITDINGITTATENSIWITSPTLLATASITVPVNLSVAATTTSTLVSTTYTLLQHWIGTNASWSVGQGGKNGQIPFTFTTWPATGHTATTSLDMSTITGPPSSTSAFTASRGGSTSTGSTTSSAGPGPTSSEASHHDRITSGAAAGIGIGSAAAGAIIALLLAFCLMRRKSSASKRYDPHDVRSSPSDESPSGFEKTPAIMMSSLPRKGDDSVVPLLPPPTQTSELVKMFSTLSTMIQNHAYSYFIEGPKVNVSSAHSINSEHVNVILGPGAPVETKMVLDLLNSPQRVVAVRIILGWGIMSNIQPRSDSDSTLLPLEFAECLRTFSEDASTGKSYLRIRCQRS